MSDQSVLRTQAREAMTTGKLPERSPERMWGGHGSGASCAVCGHAVQRGEVEYELQFTSEGNPDDGPYHVHVHCFAAWELERRNSHPER